MRYASGVDFERNVNFWNHRTTSQHNTAALKLFPVVRVAARQFFWTRIWFESVYQALALPSLTPSDFARLSLMSFE